MYKLVWDETNRVIRVIISGRREDVSLPSLKEEVINLLKNTSDGINVLVDCQEAEVDIPLLREI